MRKQLIALLFLAAALQSYAGDSLNAVLLERKGIGHLEHFVPFDQPDVYYDSDNQTIIIDGGGAVSYYDVEIEPVSSSVPVISTQVSGYYDTIDVSSLSTGEYVITIYSPTNNTFEGFFEIE